MPEIRYRVNVEVPTESAKKASAAVHELDGHLKATEDHAKKAGGALSAVLRTLGLHAAGFHSVGLAAHEAHEKTSEFLEFIGAEAVLEVLKEIGEKVFEIGEEMIRSAAKAQRMNRVIDIAAGGAEGGENTRKWIEQFSKASEFSEETNELAYVALKKVGVKQKDAGLFMKAAADVAAVSANKDEAFQSAIGAFERLQVTGKVNARMLRPLGIGVNDLKTLGGQYANMNVKQLNKVLESGTFGQNDILRLIMSRAHETKLGQRSADNVDLLSTKMEKLTELPERFYKKLADTKAVGALGTAFDSILSKLDPDSASGQKVFGGLEAAATAVASAIGSIDYESLASGIGSVASEIGPAVELLKEMAHDAKAVADALAPVANLFIEHGPIAWVGKALSDRMAKRAGLTAPVITDRMKGFDPEKAKAIIHARGGAQPASEGPTYQPPEFNSLSAATAGTGAAIPAGLAQGAKANAGVATAAVGDVADSMVDTVRKKHKTHSPSEVFSDIGAMAAEGMAQGVERGAGRVAGAVDAMVAIPAAGSGNGKAPISVQIHVGGINLAHGGKAEGDAAADAFEKRIRGIIIDVIEQAQQGGGN